MPPLLVFTLVSLVLGGSGGWYLRDVFADRAALKIQNAALEATKDAQTHAIDIAVDLDAKRAALKPQIQVVRLTAEKTVIRELEKCTLPMNSADVLKQAADIADK